MRRKFLRTGAGKVKRVSLRWKKPRGIHNKRRHNKKGRAPTVTAGYGKDLSKRGTSKGLIPVIISSKEQLKLVEKAKHGIIIAKTGKKMKNEIIAEAEKLGLTFINFNVARYKQKTDEFLKERKEATKSRAEKAKIKAKEAEKETKKKEEKKDEPKELTEEEKKKQEKEERDRVLTKKA